MQLSESLNKGIFETFAGSLTNKFQIKRRRNVLFFEDILANYFKECEDDGYEKEIEKIGQTSAKLGMQGLTGNVLRKVPASVFMNLITKRVLHNVGLTQDFHFSKSKDIIKIETEGEIITRIVGKNDFITGTLKGLLSFWYGDNLDCVERIQEKNRCSYTFVIKEKSRFVPVECKTKDLYNSVNFLHKTSGITLKEALKSDVLQLKEKNRICFRGKSLLPIENTLGHLIAHKNINMDKLASISYRFFDNITKETDEARKLNMIKNILQITGWGTVNIVIRNKKELLFEIINPPYGLQGCKDNWNFLIMNILGFLWTVDKKFKIKKTQEKPHRLLITFSR